STFVTGFSGMSSSFQARARMRLMTPRMWRTVCSAFPAATASSSTSRMWRGRMSPRRSGPSPGRMYRSNHPLSLSPIPPPFQPPARACGHPHALGPALLQPVAGVRFEPRHRWGRGSGGALSRFPALDLREELGQLALGEGLVRGLEGVPGARGLAVDDLCH